jgi:hypothetical protein
MGQHAFAEDEFNAAIRPGGQEDSTASPIAANGYIYTVNESGTFTVLRAGDTLQVVAISKLCESARSTPAVAGDNPLRTQRRTSVGIWGQAVHDRRTPLIPVAFY